MIRDKIKTDAEGVDTNLPPLFLEIHALENHPLDSNACIVKICFSGIGGARFKRAPTL